MRISDWSSDVCSSDLAGTDTGHALEMAFPRCSVFKDKSRRQKDWRLQCAFGKRGVKTMTHHQCRRLQSLAGNLQYRGFRSPARRGGMGPIVLLDRKSTRLNSSH